MSKRLKALIQERADLVKEQQSIFAAAEARADLALTAEEKSRDDVIAARQTEITAEIAREERRKNAERALVLPADTQITGGDELAAEKPFRTLGENMLAARTFATTHEAPTAYKQYVANTQKLMAASGLNENLGAEGGMLVMTDFVAGILAPMRYPESAPFTSRARNIPISSDANGLVLNAVNETSRATGSRWGGIRGYRLAEAGTLTGSKPDFRRMELRLKKYGVLFYATDELLRDASALERVATEGAGEELAFMANDDILNGLGAAGALGIVNAGAMISVTKETGQAAATILNANLVKMWQRLHPRNRGNAAWFINSECEPQLDQLTLPAGTGAVEPRYVAYGPDGVLRIKGRPVIVTEFNAALGTVGDIVLADLSDYITVDKGGVQAATSIHVQFLTDETAFRFIYRLDGQPSLAAPITPYKGSNTQSAYVALATRA